MPIPDSRRSGAMTPRPGPSHPPAPTPSCAGRGEPSGHSDRPPSQRARPRARSSPGRNSPSGPGCRASRPDLSRVLPAARRIHTPGSQTTLRTWRAPRRRSGGPRRPTGLPEPHPESPPPDRHPEAVHLPGVVPPPRWPGAHSRNPPNRWGRHQALRPRQTPRLHQDSPLPGR